MKVHTVPLRKAKLAMSFHITLSNNLTSYVDLASVPWGEIWGMSASELGESVVRVGKQLMRLEQISQIERAEDGQSRITVSNSSSRVHGIAVGLKSDEILVEGDAGDRVGLEMTGGFVRVRGSVGDDLGGASPGLTAGMRGGEIHVSGNAGDRVGARLRRGIIAIAGSVGADCGLDAIAGTIVVLGGIGARSGMGMKRASLVIGSGEAIDSMRYEGAMKAMPAWLRVYFRSLSAKGFLVPASWMQGTFQRFTGDQTGLGKGEIWALCD